MPIGAIAWPKICGTKWPTAICTRSCRASPLWLDEGLAEYFEVPRGSQGLNDGHVRQLATEMAIGLAARHGPAGAICNRPPSMDQRDYAEAWAWAHLLLETTPERLQLLRAYLADLRSRRLHCEPISARLARLEPDMNKQSLLHHVAGLASSLR